MYVKNKQKVECSSPGYLAEFDKFVENESVKESETTEITVSLKLKHIDIVTLYSR